MKAEQIALQLYTVRDRTAKDFVGTLRELAAMGYRAVELAGFGGLGVTEMRGVLDDLGLRAMGAHVQFAQFEASAEQAAPNWRRSAATTRSCLPCRRNFARTRRCCARRRSRFNRWGAVAQAAGQRFAYHNHAFEFAPLGNGTAYDIIAGETDPALVALEVDLFWAFYGGVIRWP